jgi:hypothetical protein
MPYSKNSTSVSRLPTPCILTFHFAIWIQPLRLKLPLSALSLRTLRLIFACSETQCNAVISSFYSVVKNYPPMKGVKSCLSVKTPLRSSNPLHFNFAFYNLNSTIAVKTSPLCTFFAHPAVNFCFLRNSVQCCDFLILFRIKKLSTHKGG